MPKLIDEIQFEASRAHHLSEGLLILMRDGTVEATSASHIAAEELCAMTRRLAEDLKAHRDK